MLCKNCGKPIADGLNFCGNCGEMIEKQSSQIAPETSDHIVPPPLPMVEATALPSKQAVPKSPPTNDAPPMPKAAPIKKKKNGFLGFIKVILSIVLTLPIIAVLALFIISAVTSNKENKLEDSTIKAYINSTFDAGDDMAPKITDVTPTSAAHSTTIKFTGSNFDASRLVNITINEQDLNISEIAQNSIQAVITYGAKTGDIVLNFVDGQITINEFEILEQQKTLILEEEVKPSDSPQTIVTQDISITLPAGAVQSPQTLQISEVVNPQTINLPSAENFRLFSITLGDVSQFDDIVTIILDISSDTEGRPTAVYFDENTSQYNTLPSEVIDGKLHIYTNHLTDFAKIQWGTSHLSSDEYFRMHYFDTDTVSYTATMDELAVLVGEMLEQVRKDYERVIPDGYRETFSTMYIKDSMEVYISSSVPNCKYKALSNHIVVPTNFSNKEKFETELAHEFFHAYQDTVWNEIMGIGTMAKSENLWAVEALAELAAYEIAYPGRRHRAIDESIKPTTPYNTFNSIHEYSMSCYLRYLLDITKSKPEDLWVSVAGSSDTNLENSINSFFKSKSSTFVSLADSYTAFWMAVLGDKNAPEHYNTFNFVDELELSAYERVAAFEYLPKNAYTMEFYMLDITGFPDNVPIRIFNMQCTEDSANGAWSTKIAGIGNVNNIAAARISGGHPWEYTSSATDSYKRFVFEKGKDEVVLVGLDGKLENQLAAVRFTEIKSNCMPDTIQDETVGVEQMFEITFNDVFQNIENALLVVDFGDGETAEFPQVVTYNFIAETAFHVYDELFDGVVKLMLYDTTNSKKELIAQLNVPVSITNELGLTASPNPTQIAQEVSFQISEKNSAYTYNWSLGDGTTNNKIGITELTHTYEEFGSYTVSVAVYDELDEHIGTAKLIMTVEEPIALSGKWQYIGETYTDFGITYRGVSIITFYDEGNCIMSMGIQSTETQSIEDTPCTYTFYENTSKGTITFVNQETGGKETMTFTINGNSLFLAGTGITYIKTQ